MFQFLDKDLAAHVSHKLMEYMTESGRTPNAEVAGAFSHGIDEANSTTATTTQNIIDIPVTPSVDMKISKLFAPGPLAKNNNTNSAINAANNNNQRGSTISPINNNLQSTPRTTRS